MIPSAYELLDKIITNKLNEMEINKDNLKEINSNDFIKYLRSFEPEQLISEIKMKNLKVPIYQEFIVTREPIEEENWAKLPAAVKEEITNIFYSLNISAKKNYLKETLNKLLAYQADYPKVPGIYNYLCNVYYLLNEKEKQYETILEMLKKFPRYLFGKISLAQYYSQNGNSDKIASAFNNKMEIYQHFPAKRKIFHFSEVMAFYMFVGDYYLSQKMIEHVLLCYLLLIDIDKAHPMIKQIEKKIYLTLLNEKNQLIKDQTI